jgi:hypothetical protein
MNKSRRIWWIVPAWLWFAADLGLTLMGQSTEYWDGNYAQATEANPLAFHILTASPWLFVGLALAWAIFLGLLTIFWRRPLVTWIAIAMAVLHAIAGCSWFVRLGEWGWVLAIVYLVMASEISWWCWRRAEATIDQGWGKTEKRFSAT